MIIVGLDWSRCKHDFVMMNLQGEILERGTIAHNTNALEELATRIEHRVDSAKQVRVGLELNDGALLAWQVTKDSDNRNRFRLCENLKIEKYLNLGNLR